MLVRLILKGPVFERAMSEKQVQQLAIKLPGNLKLPF